MVDENISNCTVTPSASSPFFGFFNNRSVSFGDRVVKNVLWEVVGLLAAIAVVYFMSYKEVRWDGQGLAWNTGGIHKLLCTPDDGKLKEARGQLSSKLSGASLTVSCSEATLEGSDGQPSHDLTPVVSLMAEAIGSERITALEWQSRGGGKWVARF